ncbi:MAG TPA: ATP-binding protein, partial [Rectinemataceae bacterium]|nr:ATP-binding protein [Rectinemataceae bacterium]
EDRGYAVLSQLSSERAACLSVEDPRIDLVLLDASSPRRDGLGVCERIRKRKSLSELPVIVMTDRDSSESVAEAFRAGASDYLPKLAPTELLFARVDTHVALKRALSEAIETRRRVAEFEKLKTLGVLSAGVAHEINTPNNAVLRNLPIISEVWKEISPIVHRLMVDSGGFSVRGWSAQELLDELPELLNDTYAAGKQIKKIVEDLKDYARGSSGMPLDAVDLSAVAAYAARLLGPLVERSTRRFQLDAPPGLPPTRADFQKLTQVAVNVLENALQSLSGPDRGVRMTARSNPGQGTVLLECRDEGIGIDSSIRARIFEPFFTTKRDKGGTGLGLSVSLGIVREYGGDIEIDSVAGEGTVVRVVLPVAGQERSA